MFALKYKCVELKKNYRALNYYTPICTALDNVRKDIKNNFITKIPISDSRTYKHTLCITQRKFSYHHYKTLTIVWTKLAHPSTYLCTVLSAQPWTFVTEVSVIWTCCFLNIIKPLKLWNYVTMLLAYMGRVPFIRVANRTSPKILEPVQQKNFFTHVRL